MKYVACDIETTGLDPLVNQTIEIAAIIDDLCEPDVPIENLPKFHILLPQKRYVFDEVALRMHVENGLLAELLGLPTVEPSEIAPLKFNAFLVTNNMSGRITGAGKNFAQFDNQFLKRIGINCFDFRCIDPGNFFINPTDLRFPNIETCVQRADIKINHLNHRAMSDTELIVQLVRAGMK